MAEPVKIESWHGGITDDYVDAAPHFSKKMHELLLNRSGKPVQRPGTEIYNSSALQIPPGTQRIDGLYYFDSTLFVKSGTRLYYLQDGDTAWSTLATDSVKDAFADSEVGAKVSWAVWGGFLYALPGPSTNKKGGCRVLKIYRSSSTTWTCVRAGMPRAQDGTYDIPASSGAGGDENFVTYLMFYRSYTAYVDGNTVTFEDYGKPDFVQHSYEDRASYTVFGLDWTNPTLDSYPDSTINVRAYRTKNNDVTPLYSGQFTQGTNITFTVDDDDLGAEAYFAGGVRFWDPVPLCYYMDVVQGYGFYAAGVDVDSGSFFGTRIWQSHPGKIDAVPAGNFIDAPGLIKGFKHIGIYPIVFLKSQCFRIEGRFDAFGNGGMSLKEISATEGCISNDAIVAGEGGLFFPSETGWCFTDGFRVKKLSQHLVTTYKALSNKSRMSGCFDGKNRRVYWGCEESTLNTSGGGANTTLFVLDVNHTDDQGEMGVFMTAGRAFRVSSNAMHYDSVNDRILMGHHWGYVLKFDSTKTTDLDVAFGVGYASWSRVGISWSWVSPAFSYGSSLVTKLMQRIQVIAKNVSASFSADIWSFRDDETTGSQLKEIRERPVSILTGLHKAWRWFKKGKLRCRYNAVQIDKGFVNMFRSDDYALATVNSAGKTAALASGTWPDDGAFDLRGHYIAFEVDGYTAEHQISVDAGGTTITMLTAPAGNPAGKKWVIRGYPKNESLELRGVEIQFDIEDSTVLAYQSGGDNANG